MYSKGLVFIMHIVERFNLLKKEGVLMLSSFAYSIDLHR